MTFFYSQYDRLLGSDAAASGGSGSGELFNGGSASITGIEGSWSVVKGNFTFKTSEPLPVQSLQNLSVVNLMDGVTWKRVIDYLI